MLTKRQAESPTMKIEPWDEISQGAPDKRRVFTVRSDVMKSRVTGRQHTVDQLLAPDWVNVVAITDENDMLFVRQWRFGARAFTLEIPAGLMEPGEGPLAAGQRELLEETGYAGLDARVIGTVLPNPAFMNNKAITIYLPRVTRVAEQHLDPMEELELVKIPVERVEQMLKEGGELATAIGMVALMWWMLAR
jgi:8-oxo-dGTP pyrophosphatase MutT (NUDIX family)